MINPENMLPLKGRTVVITRAQNKQAEAKSLFSRLGAKVLDLPALVITPPDEWVYLDNALSSLHEFDWIVFSSANGVTSCHSRLRKLGKSLDNDFPNLKTAVVGKKTALKLKGLGINPTFVPPEYVAESLVHNFPFDKPNCSILLPRVQSGGRSFLANEFTKFNAKVLEVPAYESSCPKSIPAATLEALDGGLVDAIAFTSGKTVIHTVHLLQKYFGNKWEKKLEGIQIISIGPQTSISCKKYLKRISKEANPHDLDGLLFACINSLDI